MHLKRIFPGFTIISMVLSSLSAFGADSNPFTFQTETYGRGTRTEYKIENGRLLERTSGNEWKLHGGMGLPHPRGSRTAFPMIKSLKRVFADADCIAVTDQDGRVYFYQSAPVFAGARQPYAWDSNWGQPAPHPLYLKSNFRAVSFSRHTDESLKYMEDALGIAHGAGGASYLINLHKEKRGHSGLTHFYALSEDGTQLFFADSGLPASINYEYPLPRARQGNPIAIASRGSVVAILTDQGEVFTKLLDFDFMGHNPMMYGYRYNAQSLIDEMRGHSFTDLTPSHYGTINLPYPYWKKHEISGAEDLLLGSNLDMETTGPGIHNRELFLQYKDKNGGCGVLRKTFAEANWRREVSVDCSGLNLKMLSEHTAPRIERPSFHFSGELRVEVEPKGSRTYETFPFEISDFDLVNYEAKAVIHARGLPIAIKLHTVFTWGPFRIENPGFDGRPKLFHVTFDLPNDTDLPEALKKLHFEPFSTWLWGTKDHLIMESRNGKVSGEFFSDSNASRTHFIPAHGKKLKLKEIEIRLQHAHAEKITLSQMSIGVKTSHAITSVALINYWPRAMDATFPPVKRLLIWGGAIVKQRLKILNEEMKELQKMKSNVTE